MENPKHDDKYTKFISELPGNFSSIVENLYYHTIS